MSCVNGTSHSSITIALLHLATALENSELYISLLAKALCLTGTLTWPAMYFSRAGNIHTALKSIHSL